MTKAHWVEERIGSTRGVGTAKVKSSGLEQDINC